MSEDFNRIHHRRNYLGTYIFACVVSNIVVVVFTLRRQRGRMVNASDSQSGGPEFESYSGDLLDLLAVIQSSNPQPRL